MLSVRGSSGNGISRSAAKPQRKAFLIDFKEPSQRSLRLSEKMPCRLRRKLDSATALETLEKLNVIVQPIPRTVYSHYETLARERVEMRGPDDWPVAALALVLSLPIWTEDPDFFGSGIATWTTDRVELYLRP